MSRGKRYSSQPRLNMKKVFAVVIVIVVIIIFIIALSKLLQTDNATSLKTTEYYSLYENDKWGVIDNNSNIIIEPTYDEIITIPDHTKDVFICTENINYENETYTTKVVDSKNKEILRDYNQVEAIENYDENYNLWYEENVLTYINDNQYGLINLDGDILLEAKFDDIYALRGTKDALVTIKDEKLGLINNKGEEIIPNEYIEINSLGKDTDLYIVKNENNKYGIYNKLDTKYQEIKALNNKEIFCVKENNQYKLINSNGDVVFDNQFSDITQIKENIIVYINNKKYGAYDIENNKSIKCEYDQIKYTENNYFIVKQNNAYGIIDINGDIKEKIEYANIVYYEDAGIYELESKNNTTGENQILNNNLKEIAQGILDEVNSEKSYIRIWTENGYQYYNLDGESKESKDILLQNNLFLKKENGKYGFVDKDGNVVVDYIYDDAKEQNIYGYAAVKKDGKWGAIDSQGNLVCDIKYNLDDNLLIDFIGEYHLGKDINLMYYTNQ